MKKEEDDCDSMGDIAPAYMLEQRNYKSHRKKYNPFLRLGNY